MPFWAFAHAVVLAAVPRTTIQAGGGLYDHVPPFTVPVPDSIAPGACPDQNNGSAGYCTVGKLGGTFDLTGFSVPVILISPAILAFI